MDHHRRRRRKLLDLMPLGHIRKVSREQRHGHEDHCQCALLSDSLLEAVEDLHSMPRPLHWPLTRCETHEILLALPSRLQDCKWRPVFCTDVHGFSLTQLLRRFEAAWQQGPTLLIVAAAPRVDREGNQSIVSTQDRLRDDSSLFGAYLSHPPGLKHGPNEYYGSHESFVFAFAPRQDVASRNSRHGGIRVHRWREGSNQDFILSSATQLGIGGGNYGAAIQFYTDLQHATTSVHCETFGSGPLVQGNTHGLTHVELTTHRMWWFGVLEHEFAQLSPIPATVEQGDTGGADMRRLFDTPDCTAAGFHHRCPLLSHERESHTVH